MTLSRNEVAATLTKAARGQGMPLGHIEMFVTSAVQALGEDKACAVQVTNALEGPHIGANFFQARVAMAGPAARDLLLCGTEEIHLENLDAPSVLIAMMMRDNSGLNVVVDVKDTQIVLRRTSKVCAHTIRTGPLEIPDDQWALWQQWAALTYVPASDASRLAGAGAGLTDND